VRRAVGVLMLLLSVESATVVRTEYETVVRTVRVEPVRETVPAPQQPPHMTEEEWAEFERQSECLFYVLKERDMPITLETVTAADVWAEHNGGACAILEGDEDE